MEARKRQRVLYQGDVVINRVLKAHMLDISESGMYVHTPGELVEHAVIDLEFEIRGRHIAVKAVIQHSEPGIGIGVKFLNLQKFPEYAAAIRDIVKRSAPAEKPGLPKVLLIDGNDHLRSLYRSSLVLEGFAVVEASSGIDAFKGLIKHRPDLMVIDPHLEGLDGFKLLQLMKVNPELKRIPVVILSPGIVPEEVDKAISLGAKEYLLKSATTPVKLAETLRGLLKG